ncbi:winged helix DNA-binding protein [Nocardia sp. NPDC088792]|uniref:winged helix DNA-binding protein n=1 Tax=Nocardia sp. NPDC088792 TaxID=3364332 RepID=UPI003824C6F0
MDPAEVAVLAVLHPDRTMTTAQIREASALTARQIRNALARLESRGLIMSSQPRGRWRISAYGRAAFRTKGKRYG